MRWSEVTEKWSAKYKRSINCSNPKGFSQKAHCAGRKKNEDIDENFADGKKKGKSRPGRVKRSGASCNGSVTALRKRAKNSSGEKRRMYHWCANMKSGRKKKQQNYIQTDIADGENVKVFLQNTTLPNTKNTKHEGQVLMNEQSIGKHTRNI